MSKQSIQDRLGEGRSLNDAYENLISAIALQAVLDYEAIMSDAPHEGGPTMTKVAIRKFTKGTKVDKFLDRIERIYREEFRPYIALHWQEILDEWPKVEDSSCRAELEQLQRAYKHKCPACGGNIIPYQTKKERPIYIGCSTCNLNMKIPRR